MAATLSTQYSAATDSGFVNRVQISILAAAQAISTEATTVPNHANRVALMKAIANAPTVYAPLFAGLLAAEAIDNTSLDTAIDSMVSATWNTVAGVP